MDTVASRAAKLTVTPEPEAEPPSEELSLDGVSLDWSGSPELQRKAPNMQPNYLSAGVSDGTEATYRASSDGVGVLHVTPSGDETGATWATRSAQTAGAVEQVVRLIDGHAEIETDGSALVTWGGSFSVNFYGGLVPFTLADPELTVDADGNGTLSADLSGYGASQRVSRSRRRRASRPRCGPAPAGAPGRRRSSTSMPRPASRPSGTRPEAPSTSTSRRVRSASTSVARRASHRRRSSTFRPRSSMCRHRSSTCDRRPRPTGGRRPA